MSRKNVIANRYEVVSHIGQGGMADVFLAVDTILNRQVAIKILRSDMSSDETSILRFQREAQAATALAHPNIVEIYDVGEYKKHHFIVMEYLPGHTLKQIIRARGPLFAEEAVDIMKQLTSAVSAAHSRGIIHRDLKPQNIIVKADGSVKILDFGIATAKGAMQLTQANNVMGSVHYLAPELARGKSASAQSDIYALGIIFYEMLSGDVPFKAEQAVQVAIAHMKQNMPRLRDTNPTLPQALENIVNRATAKDPADRYASCEEMLRDIVTCLLPERAGEQAVLFPLSEEPKKTAPPKPKAEPKTKQKTKTGTFALSSKAKQNAAAAEDDETEAPVKRTASGKRRTSADARKTRRMNMLLFSFIALIAVAAVIATLIITGVIHLGSGKVRIPELEGMTLAEAKDACVDSGLVLDGEAVTYTLTDDVDKGKIVFVDPEIGTEVDKGTYVTVTVSSGIGVEMDDFIGMNINDAESRIASASDKYALMKVNVVEEASDEPAGRIIRQEKLAPGDKFNPEVASQVTLVYSSYPTVTIPEDIIGMDINEAVRKLEGMDIVVRTSNRDTTQMTQEELDNLVVGVVIECAPAAGTSYTQKGNNYITLYFY